MSDNNFYVQRKQSTPSPPKKKTSMNPKERSGYKVKLQCKHKVKHCTMASGWLKKHEKEAFQKYLLSYI